MKKSKGCILKIATTLFLLFIVFIYFIRLATSIAERDASYMYFEKMDDITRIIIGSSDPNNNEIHMIDTVEDIEAFKNVFQIIWNPALSRAHKDDKYYIDLINDYLVFNLSFNDLLSDEQINFVNSFMTDKNKKYQYEFNVNNLVDFEELKQNISDEGNITFSPKKSIIEAKSYITLEYYGETSDSEEKAKLAKDLSLGEFELDDYFMPFVDECKNMGVYYSDKCRTTKWTSDSSSENVSFRRMITVYLKRSLTQDEVIILEKRAGENLIYNEFPEYEIKVIFDREQNINELESFCLKYSVARKT